MRVFLSASIRGGRKMLHMYIKMCSLLQQQGHEVLSWHVADPALDEAESLMTEQEIYEHDMKLLRKSECLIAEVSTPSIGVGYEVCSALQLGLPVLCLHSPQANVSAMILGNSDPGLVASEYANEQELQKIMITFLSGLEQVTQVQEEFFSNH
ncbi:nucleoside 2-deoxyribosyltransferase [Methanolobus halotolerans]|uniref:Putative 2'-deoxynucleoside 5'-phosphate N-hydrolase 1 n=1 Tax=Methanolobus halotolerans TaxID=2052935 RepID=A0A4E0Q4Z7_9EURY|nr:nucleoside 2-deoxyribosyltransferase [Methanolobus halotolerans]TGC08941.1 deoxyribonucleoside 5'-monophosphate N-glycosidase [Methanolobus halotolerans]